ncbi:MAG: hypothetical protein HKL95_05165 [Phycisphaerae bacterium]|nr:hypothetical protein [Phycisphaerae bacterium]
MAVARTAAGAGPDAGLAAVLAAMTLNWEDLSVRQRMLTQALAHSDRDSLCLVELLQNNMGVDAGDLIKLRQSRCVRFDPGTVIHAFGQDGGGRCLAFGRTGVYTPGVSDVASAIRRAAEAVGEFAGLKRIERGLMAGHLCKLLAGGRGFIVASGLTVNPRR